ncbi:MAG: GNAT family N-acetyltransferase [Chitinophagales bacterium]
MSDYFYKRVDESCYKDLVYLFEAAFNTKTDINYYRHKMDTGYLGVRHLGYVAYDESMKPAAFYGVYPYKTEYKGKEYLAAQSGDTMTHPSHTGKGLFTTLAKMTYQLAKEEGIQFIFGYPNQNSYPGFVKKLSWTHRENMTNYVINVVTFPCAAIAKKVPFLLPLHKRYVRFVAGFYPSKKIFLASSVINLQYGGVIRNEEFHRYKSYYDNYLVDLGGCTAWVKVDGSLAIGDIELQDAAHVTTVIRKIKKLAFWLGCNKILFAVGKDTNWDLLLKGKYENMEGIPVGYLDLQSGLPLENMKYIMADYDTF